MPQLPLRRINHSCSVRPIKCSLGLTEQEYGGVWNNVVSTYRLRHFQQTLLEKHRITVNIHVRIGKALTSEIIRRALINNQIAGVTQQ